MASSDSTLPERRSINILKRNSSKNVLEEKKLKLRASKIVLKRKISDTSLESSPIAYCKLKIEELSTEKEEQELEKTRLDIEYEDRNLNEKEYRKAHRNVSRRIISVGDELWRHEQDLLNHQEKFRKTPAIEPDSKQAFIYILLALYKDPKVSSKRSSTGQSNMRKSSIEKYESAKGAGLNKLWCPITRDYYDSKNIRAAHIVPHRVTGEIADYLFELGTGSRLSRPDNCLVIHHLVERALDNGCFVLMPADISEIPISSWKIVVTDTSAGEMDFGRGRLKDFDGKILEFKNDNRPATKFLYFHFLITLLQNKRDRVAGWEKNCLNLPSGKPFATPGRYMRQSLFLALAKTAGDLSVEEEAKLLGEAEVYQEDRNLEAAEEAEIARRIMANEEDIEDEEGEAVEDNDDEDDEDDEDVEEE